MEQIFNILLSDFMTGMGWEPINAIVIFTVFQSIHFTPECTGSSYIKTGLQESNSKTYSWPTLLLIYMEKNADCFYQVSELQESSKESLG